MCVYTDSIQIGRMYLLKPMLLCIIPENYVPSILTLISADLETTRTVLTPLYGRGSLRECGVALKESMHTESESLSVSPPTKDNRISLFSRSSTASLASAPRLLRGRTMFYQGHSFNARPYIYSCLALCLLRGVCVEDGLGQV